jgi:hypothetical protein
MPSTPGFWLRAGAFYSPQSADSVASANDHAALLVTEHSVAVPLAACPTGNVACKMRHRVQCNGAH